MSGTNQCYICHKKIPKGQVICDKCNAGDDDEDQTTSDQKEE